MGIIVLMHQLFLAPLKLACETLRLMDTNCGPATGAGPLGLFTPDKTLYPRNAYGLEILDHAHPVFRPVTLVYVGHQFAGEA